MSRLAPALAAFLDLPAERRRIGPFQLAQSLGKGGFAPVWLAHESYGGVRIRTAAVKLFSFELAGAAGSQSTTTMSKLPGETGPKPGGYRGQIRQPLTSEIEPQTSHLVNGAHPPVGLNAQNAVMAVAAKIAS